MPETPRILVVDDEDALREIVVALLEEKGYPAQAAPDALKGLEQLNESPGGFSLVISDIIMPGMTGLQFLERVRAKYPDLPMIMTSALHDIRIAMQAMRGGAYDYLVKPFEKEQLYLAVDRALDRQRLVEENRRYQDHLEDLVKERTEMLEAALKELERSYDFTLEALGNALDLKDSETEGHSRRVTSFTIEMARRMRLEEDTLRTIARGAYLHDIGKMAIPDSILLKPGALTAEEKAVMQTHCRRGYDILARVSALEEVAEIVLSHQECYDGSGYPRGLKGEEIHLGARIFAVADTLDAMTSDRPYRRALSLDQARREISAHRGTQFDPAVVDVFLSVADEVWVDLRRKVSENFHTSVLNPGPAAAVSG